MAKKKGLLKNVIVSFSESTGRFYSCAELNVKGYTLEVPVKYYKDIDAAFSSIKIRIIDALREFKIDEKIRSFNEIDIPTKK